VPGACVLCVLSLTLSHKKSSLRGSVAQTADGNKQGAEPPGHPYHLVGLSVCGDGAGVGGGGCGGGDGDGRGCVGGCCGGGDDDDDDK